MRPLYELVDRYAAICELAFDDADDEGQLSEAFTALLQELEDGIETKFEQCGYAMRNMQAMEAALKHELERLSKRRQRVEDRIDRLKAYLKKNMEDLGKEKYQAGIFSYSICKNGGNPSVDVKDESVIPKAYWYQPPAVVDKKLIIEVSKTGVAVPGVELTRGKHLRIS